MATAPGPAWAVDGQRESVQVGPGGRLVEGVEVTYTTGAGHTGTVFVDRRTYADVAAVRALIADAAAHSDTVGSLTADNG